ncbi:MAG: hypothetical protein ACM338_04620 [Betaproteobacteria bacterium]
MIGVTLLYWPQKPVAGGEPEDKPEPGTEIPVGPALAVVLVLVSVAVTEKLTIIAVLPLLARSAPLLVPLVVVVAARVPPAVTDHAKLLGVKFEQVAASATVPPALVIVSGLGVADSEHEGVPGAGGVEGAQLKLTFGAVPLIVQENVTAVCAAARPVAAT